VPLKFLFTSHLVLSACPDNGSAWHEEAAAKYVVP